MKTMRFVAESTGNKGSQVMLGRHKIVFDMPKRMGGDSRGAGPLAVFAAAIAACAHYAIARVLVSHDLVPDDARVIITTPMAQEGPKRFTGITLDVELPGGVSDAIRTEIHAAILGCPVHNVLMDPPEIELKIAL